MDDGGGAPRCSSGGLSTLSHQLMSKFSAAANKECLAGGCGESSRSAPADKNLVFSPLFIYSALSLAAAGAKGRTLSELLDVLGAKSRESLAVNVRFMVDRALPDAAAQKHKSLAENVRCVVQRALQDPEKPKPGGGPRVEHACGLWHDAARTLKPAYRDVAAASCKAAARAVDFLNKPEEARKDINRWVASATNKLIDSILPPGSVDKSTRLVVATAIYFKGMWRTPFDASLTKEGKFHRLDGTTVDGAQFMRSHRDQYIATYTGFKVLKMPYAAVDDTFVELDRRPRAIDDERRPLWYDERRPRWYDPLLEWMQPGRTPAAVQRALTPPGGPRYSMLVLLPDKRDGLPALEDKMIASSHVFLERHTPERSVEVGDFRVPRFKLSFYTEAKRVLQELGVRAVFDQVAAELPDVLEEVANNNGGETLFVGDVYHKAVIEVNEEGTEGAGSTAMTYMLRTEAALGSRPRRPKPVEFVADHPFAFFVVEDGSGAILFAGHVHDPKKT